MAVTIRRLPRSLEFGALASAIVLVFLINSELFAQTEAETCPCFNLQEVEAIFAINAAIPEDQQNYVCMAEDYKVEFTAEIKVLSSDWDSIALAHVKWFDFDPGSCEYIDTTIDPPVNRKVKWPHPAPESVARACLAVISEAIEKAGTVAVCNTYL
jgi:hypothetical protein